MADWPPLKNSAFTAEFPIYDNDGDLVSGAADLDTEVSTDGGTFADANSEATEIATSSGVYKLDCNAAEMNGDVIATMTKTSTTNAKTAVCVMYTVTRQLKDLAYPATSGRSLLVESDSMVHADIKEWLGVAPLALASQRVDVTVGAMQGDVVTAAAIADAAIDAATFAAGAIDAGAIAADAIGASEFAQAAADKVWSTAARTLTALGFTLGASDFAANAVTSTVLADDAINADVFAQAAADKVWSTAARTLTALGFTLANTDFAAGAIDAGALAADAALEIADAILKRDIDQVEATAPKHSLTTAILKAVSRIVDDAGTLKTYRTDGSTLHMSQTITVNATADPIDELTVGA